MDIIIKSLAAAIVTGIILIIARFVDPKTAGAIGGIPIIFAISYVIVTMSDKSTSREFLIGGVYGAVAGIFFSLILIWLNSQFLKFHWINFAAAYLLCFILALSIAHLTAK